MKSTRYTLMATITAFSACGALVAPLMLVAAPQAQAQEDTEVLTRGPVHEAFAESVNFDPEAGILVSTQPPEPIDELPPDQELEGDNVTWIPGYWAWDEDQTDFLWVSGVWRNVPPDREWVPGYWNDVGNQYQWISGYWADSGEAEVTYLPKPPKTVETGPNIARPSEDDSWIPGGWVWSDTRYRWRPGYWEPLRQDWSYVPSHYVWSPRGYVYVDGYWDYAVERRGVMFAPVRFRGDYRRSGFVYSPVTVINIAVVLNHLFVRPSYGHYYFGDYYEPRYRDRFYASYSYNSGIRGYDPIFAHQRWEHRADRDWDRRQREDFEYFRDNKDARPPRTWADLRELPDGGRGAKGRGKDYAIATPLAVFAKKGEGGERFKKLDQGGRDRIVTQRQEMRKFGQERKQLEVSAPAVKDGDDAKVTKVKAPRSPIMGRKAAQFSKEDAPPKRRQMAVPAGDDKPGDPTADKDGKPQPGERGQAMRDKREAKKEAKDGEATPDDNKPEPGERGQAMRDKREAKKEAKDGEATPAKPDDKPEPGERGQALRDKREAKKEAKDGDATPPKPEPTPKVKPEREPKPEPTPKVKPEREPKPEPAPKVKPEREPKPEPAPKVKPEREPKPEPAPKVKPEREPKPEPAPKVKPDREAKPEKAQVERKPQPKPEPKVQPERKEAAPKVQPNREKKGGGKKDKDGDGE